MSDFPAFATLGDTYTYGISPLSASSLGPGVTSATATAGTWPSGNLAIFVPFRVHDTVTVYKLACATGTGTTGNFDLGIYDASGNRLVSAGSTAKTTASSERVVDVTDTVLKPGMYYLAMATDGTTSYVMLNIVNAAFGKLLGLRQMASAFALPSSATFATFTGTLMPAVCAYLRSD